MADSDAVPNGSRVAPAECSRWAEPTSLSAALGIAPVDPDYAATTRPIRQPGKRGLVVLRGKLGTCPKSHRRPAALTCIALQIQPMLSNLLETSRQSRTRHRSSTCRFGSSGRCGYPLLLSLSSQDAGREQRAIINVSRAERGCAC